MHKIDDLERRGEEEDDELHTERDFDDIDSNESVSEI
jgi:hypothetical protein